MTLDPSRLEAEAAALRQACEYALRYLRAGDARRAEAWLHDAITTMDAGRELLRWCEAIGGALGVASERVARIERGEAPDTIE